jgi:hypothetical protein
MAVALFASVSVPFLEEIGFDTSIRSVIESHGKSVKTNHNTIDDAILSPLLV